MPLDIPFLRLVLTLVKISLMFIQRILKKKKKKKIFYQSVWEHKVNLTLVSNMLLMIFNI
jgi:hypothetical protein